MFVSCFLDVQTNMTQSPAEGIYNSKGKSAKFPLQDMCNIYSSMKQEVVYYSTM